MSTSQTTQQEFKINGEDLVKKLKEILKEGNIRRIIIKDEKGNTLIEMPLTVGVIGSVLIPFWVAVGAIAALATKCTVIIEKREV
jgi:Flp pilus assembly pilin Flp